MSFSEFLQWLRSFFSSNRTQGNPNSGATGNSSPTKPEIPTEPETATDPTSETQPLDSGQPVNDPTTGSEPINTASNSSETPTNPTQPNETATTPPSSETPDEEENTSSPSSEISGEATPLPPVTETPASESTTPSSETETTPAPPPEPEPILTKITCDDTKVALNREISFQIHTEPAGKYEDCTLDLSQASDASIIQNIDPVSGQFSLSFDKASKTDNDTQLIVVRNPQGDTNLAVTVSLMKLFWHNHPGRKNVCDETLFVNQCAIRMGTSLELSGIKMPEDRRILRRCTTEYRAFKHHKEGLVKGHVLAAQELANWIKSEPSTFGPRSIVHSQDEILGRSGIIFFRDGWGSTDHIDVWDGQSLVGGFPSYFDSDFKELWFWDVY